MAVIFRVLGFEKIILCDIDPFLDSAGVARAKKIVGRHIERITELSEISIETANERLDKFIYTYQCPFNFSSVEPGGVDVIVSRAVLEHIPEADLLKLHRAIWRALRNGGLALHLIDNSDHFEHVDKSISRVNFLKFSKTAWRRIEFLSGTSQNRLRHSDHKRILSSARFNILDEQSDIDAFARQSLDEIKITYPFSEKTKDDNATVESLFVLEKPVK